MERELWAVGRETRSELTQCFLALILTPTMATQKGTSGKGWGRQTDVLCQLTCSPGGGSDCGNRARVGEAGQGATASPHHTRPPGNARKPLQSTAKGRTGYGPRACHKCHQPELNP